MLSVEQEQKVIDEVRRHYSAKEKPYYLAEFGQFMLTEGIGVPPGQQLKKFLSDTFQGRLVVVQDPTVRAKIAIALPEDSEQVRQQLSGTTPSVPGGPQITYSRLPFSLILAFCQTPGEGSRVYYSIIRPYRYFVGTAAPSGFYREIGEQFRKPLPEGESARDLSNSVKQDIYFRIGKWATHEGIDLETLYIPERGQAPHPAGGQERRSLQRITEADRITRPGTQEKVPYTQ